MKVLLDHNVPKQLRRLLYGHYVRTTREMAWEQLTNGHLLRSAEEDGFEVLVTGDKNLSYQQNLTGRTTSLVVLGANSWKILRDHAHSIKAAIDACTPGSFHTVPLPSRRLK